jgi:hypothetical protein
VVIYLATWSIGSVLGVLIAGKFKPKYPIRFALLMQFPSVIWMLALGNTTNIAFIALCGFTLGIAMDFFYVFWVTTIQQHVAKQSLSKVLAYDAWGHGISTTGRYGYCRSDY